MRPLTRTAKPTGEKVPGSGPAGENTTSKTPTKNNTARIRIVLRRPMASEMIPPTRAPIAAANSSALMTTPSCNSESPSSLAIGPSAPLATPVS